MKNPGFELERKAREALRSCLSRVPFLRIKDFKRQTSKKAVKPDLLVSLAFPKGHKVLVGEIKANGQPRVAREAVNQILRYRDLFPDAYGVFLAPYISPKAGEICRQEGIGYLDLAGNCYLCFDGVYIEQEGKQNVYKDKRDLRSLYSPKAERVLRVLLVNARKNWKVEELAKEAEVSLGQVSNVKKLLMDREWIRVDKTGFMMNEPEQLLGEWQESYSFRRNKTYDFYSLRNPGQFEADLVEYSNRKAVKYALTGFSGAARLSPSVRYQRAMAYLESVEEGVFPQLDLKKVDSGANVSIFVPYDEGVFYGAREVDGAQVVSPIQVYLDVRAFRGRGEEAAHMLLEKVIRPAW